MSGLSPSQAQVLRAIVRLSAGGVAPSIREIAAECSKELGATHGLMKELRKRGKISWTPGKARSIEVVRAGALTADPEGAADRILASIVAERARGPFAGAEGRQRMRACILRELRP